VFTWDKVSESIRPVEWSSVLSFEKEDFRKKRGQCRFRRNQIKIGRTGKELGDTRKIKGGKTGKIDTQHGHEVGVSPKK